MWTPSQWRKQVQILRHLCRALALSLQGHQCPVAYHIHAQSHSNLWAGLCHYSNINLKSCTSFLSGNVAAFPTQNLIQLFQVTHCFPAAAVLSLSLSIPPPLSLSHSLVAATVVTKHACPKIISTDAAHPAECSQCFQFTFLKYFSYFFIFRSSSQSDVVISIRFRAVHSLSEFLCKQKGVIYR